MKDNTLFLVLGIILVLAIIGGIIFGIQTSNNLTSARNDITTLKNQAAASNSSISTLTDQLTSANAQITALKTLEASDVAAAKTQLTAITDQLTAANSQIASLKTLQASDIAALKTQIASFTDQITAVNTSVTTLKALEASDVAGLKTQLATLQTTLTTLQATVQTLSDKVATLTTTTTGTTVTLFSLTPISAASGGVQPLYQSLVPSTAGNIYVIGNSTPSAASYIRITNNSYGTLVDYSFAGGSVTAPVTAGLNYSVSFYNANATAVTGTVTGSFVPTGAASATTIFSPIVGYQQTSTGAIILAQYQPAAAGNFYISGTASLATAQIQFQDGAGTPVTVVFGLSNTITYPGAAGHSYTIYINNPGTTTITWSLTGQYY